MEGNIYSGHQHMSRGRMAVRELQGGFEFDLFRFIEHDFFCFLGFCFSLAATGVVVSAPYVIFALVFYLLVCVQPNNSL